MTCDIHQFYGKYPRCSNDDVAVYVPKKVKVKGEKRKQTKLLVLCRVHLERVCGVRSRLEWNSNGKVRKK